MTGRKGEERSTLVDDPASKEPLHARHEGVSNQPSYLLHRHLHPLSLSASRRRLRYTANRRTATDNDAAKCASVASRPSSPRWSTRSSQPRITYSGAVIRSCSRRSAIEAPVPPVLGDLARPFVSFRLSFLDFNSWCFFLVFYSRVLARTRFENIYIYVMSVGSYRVV